MSLLGKLRDPWYSEEEIIIKKGKVIARTQEENYWEVDKELWDLWSKGVTLIITIFIIDRHALAEDRLASMSEDMP